MQTDIFAIGCTFYRLLTGVYPFATIADIQAGVAPEDVQRLNPQVPLAVRNIVRKAIALTPADRYAGARQMREELGDAGVTHSWSRVPDPEHARDLASDHSGRDIRATMLAVREPAITKCSSGSTKARGCARSSVIRTRHKHAPCRPA